MNTAFISVASNICPETHIREAIARLTESCRVLAISRCFVTEAITAAGQGQATGQPYFINCVALIETASEPRELKYEILRPLEQALGRVRTQDKYAPRPIDLDILLFNDASYADHGITLPDPDIFTRWFLARGIQDIAAMAIDTVETPRFRNLLASLETRFPASMDVREDHDMRRDIIALIGSSLTA